MLEVQWEHLAAKLSHLGARASGGAGVRTRGGHGLLWARPAHILHHNGVPSLVPRDEVREAGVAEDFVGLGEEGRDHPDLAGRIAALPPRAVTVRGAWGPAWAGCGPRVAGGGAASPLQLGMPRRRHDASSLLRGGCATGQRRRTCGAPRGMDPTVSVAGAPPPPGQRLVARTWRGTHLENLRRFWFSEQGLPGALFQATPTPGVPLIRVPQLRGCAAPAHLSLKASKGVGKSQRTDLQLPHSGTGSRQSAFSGCRPWSCAHFRSRGPGSGPGWAKAGR